MVAAAASGRVSGSKPTRWNRSVDLPAPLGPTSAARSPAARERSTPRSTAPAPGRANERPRTSSAGGMSVLAGGRSAGPSARGHRHPDLFGADEGANEDLRRDAGGAAPAFRQ